MTSGTFKRIVINLNFEIFNLNNKILICHLKLNHSKTKSLNLPLNPQSSDFN